MSRLGDLVARLALGRNPLLRSEVEELRLQMNNLQSTMSKVAEWAGNRESLSAPSIASRTASFDMHTHQPCVFDFRSIYEPWTYSCGAAVTAATLTTGTPTVDYLYCVPYVVRRSIEIWTIGFKVTTGGGAGSVARFGIYANEFPPGIANYGPGKLIYDGGEKGTTTTGTKENDIHNSHIVLQGDRLYWLAFVAGVAAPIVNTVPGAACAAFGMSSAASTVWSIGYYLDWPYAALPPQAESISHGIIHSDDFIPAIHILHYRVGSDPQ